MLMKKQFLSKAVPRGTRTIWRYLGALFILFTFAVGNVMAAESATNNPATVEYGTGSAKKTFLDVSNTVSNATISTGSVACVTYGLFEMDKNWKPAFYSGPANGSSSSFNYSGATSVGFMAGSSAGTGTAANKSATSGYGAAKYKSTAPATIYVTGITGIAVMGKDADTKNEKRLYIKVEEYAADGTCTPVGEGDGITKSSYNKSLHITTFDAGTLSGTKYYKVTLYAGYDTNHETSQIRFTKYIIPATKYSVTYKAGEGTGSDVVDSDAKTVKAFADCSFTAPSGYEFKEWQDGSSNVVEAGASVSDNMTLTAIYRLIPTKYTVEYILNGPSGDAPTETSKAKDDVFSLAAAPSWAGHAFDGWLCSADAAVKAAGSSYTMTAANTTFTAQWHELDCKIYSLTGEIGSAEGTAGDYEVTASALILKNSNARIKLTPASGETFKTGDVITISGAPGKTTKKFSVYVYAADGSTKLATLTVANAGDLPLLSGTLSGNAEYVYLARIDGTTQNIYTCEVHRACAEGIAAGLSYAEAAVNKTEGDAAFTNTLANANDLVVVYSSSNTAVATVATNGQVTVVGPGSATITANSAVQTKAGTLYAAGSASYTLTVAALPKYHVVYDLNGGSGDVAEVDHKAGEKFNLHDGVTGITAPTNKTFVNWKDQDDALFDGGVEYTMPAKDVTLTAQWAGDVYTVKFMDGETVLDTKVVEVGSHPTDIEHPTKPLYTFAAWQLSGSDVVLDNVNGTKDATVILTARWAVAYASNVNFKEAATQALGVETALNTYHYASDAGDISFEEKGLKIKTNAARFYFNVAPGKVAEIKFGNISGATYSVDGGAAETLTSSQLKATYSASAQSCVMTMTTAAYNIVEKVTIHDPYQVTFDANGGEDVASLNGTPSVTLPLPVKGTESFLGWFDGETNVGMNGEKYTPTANITLKAHWEAVSTDARLASISFSSDAGTLSPAFDPEVTNYTYTMPYGTAAIPTITGATSVSDKAQAPIIGDAAAAWGDAQTVKGVAQSGDKKTYTITMAKAPKDGVCLIKGNVGNNTFVIDEEASLLSGTPSNSNVKSESSTYETLTGWKFNSRPAHLGLTLSEGTFQAGDVVEVFVTSEANGGGTTHKMRVFDSNEATPAHVLAESAADMVQGANRLVLPATSTSSLYLHRGASGADYENWNPYVAYFAVYRPMNPMLTAMTIDGRTVTINEDAKTATVTIPYESDLANLTIAKTIVWNAPATENSIVVNGGSAWEIGENTYKLTDKDGDATTYTITVARDVLKHTVSFNTHGGSAVASVEVVHNEYLTAVPNDPSKEDYIFKHWSLTDGGEEVNITTVQITENKEFHAVWAPDGAIKLLNGATVNHTNFITGVTADETVEFMGNTVNYAKFSGTCGSVNNVKDLTRVIAYNATTNKTKIRISAHNNSTSGRSILVKGLVEGASAAVDLATIDLGNKEDKVSEWIEFDNAANRTIYIMVGSSAGDVYFTQVKVIESGETPMKQVGEVGYSLNLNKGRFFGLASTDLAFEGLNARLSGDYTALNSGYAKLNATSMSFTVASDMNLVVTTNNSKTYYVTKGAAGTDNETAKSGVSEFDLTAGTWYITAGSSEVQFTNIAFELPKAAKPVVADMDNVEYCQGSAIDELAVSATVSDGGTMLYQWYKDGDAISGAEAATYQPTADGEYYVVVVNTKADHQNSDPTQSNTITVTGHAGTAISGTTGAEDWPDADVTISVTASGKNLHYAWYTCDDAMGTNPVAVEPAVNAAELDVTVGAADTYYKVVVSGDCGDAQEAIITVVARQAVDLQDVTGNMKWDFSKANDGSAAGSDLCTDEVLANVHGIVNNSDFKSDNIMATANKFASGKLQASMIKFHTTVPGSVIVKFANTGSKTEYRYLVVNGVQSEARSKDATTVTYAEYVPAGDVVLTVTTGNGGNMFNFTSVEFKLDNDLEPARTDEWLAPGEMGTICIPQGAVAVGADIYELVGSEPVYGKIVFETVKHMKPGKPYMFISKGTRIDLILTDETPATAPDNSGAMKGTFEQLYLTELENVYYFADHALWSCVDLTQLNVPANRAYVKLDEVDPIQDQTPAPGRVRMSLGVNGAPAVTTGVENAQMDNAPVKMIINGQLFILRGEKMYDVTGKLVK